MNRKKFLELLFDTEIEQREAMPTKNDFIAASAFYIQDTPIFNKKYNEDKFFEFFENPDLSADIEDFAYQLIIRKSDKLFVQFNALPDDMFSLRIVYNRSDCHLTVLGSTIFTGTGFVQTIKKIIKEVY